MKNYDSYLFDADGTLYDSVDLICRCVQHVAQHFTGNSVAREQVIAGIGLPLPTMLTDMLGTDLDLQEVLGEYVTFQNEILTTSVHLFPQVEEVLATLKERGKKLAIVTSRRRPSLELILQATGTSGYFDAIVTPEDTRLHKPNAEPALRALHLLGGTPNSAVFTGDALYDICSGASAGMDTVFVTWSHTSIDSLPVPPTWSIDTMAQLLPPSSAA